VMILTYKAYVHAWRGDIDEAAALLESLLSRAREIGDAQILVPVLIVRALIESQRGRHSEALERIQEVVTQTRDKPAFRSSYMPELSRICLRAGVRDAVAELVEGTEEPRIARRRHCLRAARALLTEMEGRLAEGAALHAEAAESWGAYGAVVEKGHALLAGGRCLVGLGRLSEAAPNLEEARGIFSGIGAQPLVAEADGWLSQAKAG
jgi:tetratricopeptide (TPR) repeat protein